MPETDFADFDLIPDEGLTLTPDEEAALYEDPDALLPQDDAGEGLPYGRTIFLDWSGTGELTEMWVSGHDALVQVAQMALNVVRGTCPLLPDWFGRSGPEALLGATDDAELRALHQSDIRDTLLSCHERISDVSGFKWTYDEDATAIGFEADVEVDGEVVTLIGGV